MMMVSHNPHILTSGCPARQPIFRPMT